MEQRKAGRLIRRSHGRPGRAPGWLARRAWRQLVMAFEAEDTHAVDAVCAIAGDDAHSFAPEARTAVADQWFQNRSARLLQAVQASRARGSTPASRLAAAAVCDDLPRSWGADDQSTLANLLDDPDERIRQAVERQLVEAARDAEDPRQRAAVSVIAARWAITRDAGMRSIVVETLGLAPSGYPRLVTLALHGDLAGTAWQPRDDDLRRLLSETDPDVAVGVRKAVSVARGATADALWSIGLGWARQQAAADAAPWWDSALTCLLMRSSTPPPAHVLDALWTAWLTVPDPALVSRLHAWGIPTASVGSDADVASLLETRLASRQRPPRPEGVLRLAQRRDHPIGDRALGYIASDDDLLEEFCGRALNDEAVRSACIRGRLAPRNGTRRASWFLLTNQLDEYRNFDADGSLLALAYTASSAKERQRLQEAMRRAGGLDLVRVLVGADRRGRIQTMTAPEIDYLATALATREEWQRLWGIVLDLPLSTAIPIMRHFHMTSWQPADEDSRELFSLFRATTPDSVQRALSDIRDSWPIGVHQARIHFNGPVNDVSFAPDAPILAVAGSQQTAGLIDLRTGTLEFHFEGFSSSVGRVLHLGNSTFIAAERTNTTFNPCRVHVCHADPSKRRGTQRPAVSVSGSVTSLAERGDRGYIAGTRSGHVMICDDVDQDPAQVPVTTFGLDPDSDWPREVTTSPSTGAMALLGRQLLVANQESGRVLARGSTSKVIQRAVFASEEVLAVGDRSGEVTLMRMRGASLTPTHHRNHHGLGGLTAVPARGQVIAADREGANVHVSSATNLEHLGSLTNDRWGTARSVHASQDGDLLAVGCIEGFTDIYDLRMSAIPTMITRPMVAMVPNEIARLTAGVAAAPRGRVASTLTLLLAALQHRFRFDIELVDTGALKAGDYDIALA